MKNDHDQHPAQSPYILANAAREAAARFPALPAAFDPGTIRQLEQLGVGSGWRCFEVNGGGGVSSAIDR
jgi:hypothetical protein